jgi:hypothetical protein
MEKPTMKKTTLLIPMALWLRASKRVLEDAERGVRTNIRTLLLEGLEMRLAKKGSKGS